VGGWEKRAGVMRGYRPETWVTDWTGDMGDSFVRKYPGIGGGIPGCLGARPSR
jgi:hypothetical protein